MGVIKALALGAAVGAIFAALGLRAPAPDNLPGLAGIIGLAAGWAAAAWLIGKA